MGVGYRNDIQCYSFLLKEALMKMLNYMIALCVLMFEVAFLGLGFKLKGHLQ
jgi:hypothetical protein